MDALRPQVGNIHNSHFFVNGNGPVFVNEGTGIDIDEKNVGVRDALTDGVSLDGYNRIVWTAMTLTDSGEISIHYKGNPRIIFQRSRK